MHQDGQLADHGYGERDISALFILKEKLFGRGEA
jgi:hypothetical protein